MVVGYLIIGAMVGISLAVIVKIESDKTFSEGDDLFGFACLGAMALFAGLIWPVTGVVAIFALTIRAITGKFVQKGGK